ncbi:YitT family protein [Streptomyces sp. NPDC053513]|uniref:membrane protein YczE n=1 Tax=unclassified Streptomyces TaxID=2593676 RepID=UPI0037D32546
MSQSTTTTLGGSSLSIASGLRGRHLTRRLVQLYVGLTLYGASSALLVRSGLGLEPWNVLHQGLAEKTGLSIGVVSIVVGALVLLLWLPIRQRPGLGTVSNVFVIGLAMDGTLALVPDVHGLAGQVPLLVLGIALNGVATGLYIAARFGPGPRDGLMTGLHRLTGRSIRLVRTAIEVVVVATGFLLGGSVGVGTVLYALAIGPLAQFFLRWFALPEPDSTGAAPASGTVPGGATAASGPAPAGATPGPGGPVLTPGPDSVPSSVAIGTPEGAILRP